MRRASHIRVANPPAKPLMLFDGDCHFCRRWIERWRENTGDRIEYLTSQEAGARFPEIPAEEFEQAVQFIEADGTVYRAAEAVCRSLGYGESGGWLNWVYEKVPGWAGISEAGYSIVAQNRYLASTATRLLWGRDVRQPSYQFARGIFLRALGLIFLIAFLSLWMQVDGLIGSHGISPVGDFLNLARAQLGARASLVLPTLCWINSSNAALHFLCGAGAVFSLLLVFGLLPGLSLAASYVCYLSLVIAGQDFLRFQWDILLLETGFLAIFVAPWGWRRQRNDAARVSGIGLFLLKLLLFKLMLMSGVVKLTSGDHAWWDLTALNYHYQTQPLPSVLGWWAHQSPEWFRHFSTGFVLAVEVIVPFLIWLPRRARLLAFGLLVLLQILIAATGNYAFFNLLTIALCLLLIDDSTWSRWIYGLRTTRGVSRSSISFAAIPRVAILLILLPINACLIFNAFRPEGVWPRSISALYQVVEPFRFANGYGLFRVMTKTRPEIVIEGSADGIDWAPYSFNWKPGELKTPLRWVAPHQPRLDWQMWFAALGSSRQNRWFFGLVEQLLHGRPSVTGLLEHNPFPQTPPRYVRAILYEYRFATVSEHRESGDWWKRRELREYLRPVSLGER